MCQSVMANPDYQFDWEAPGLLERASPERISQMGKNCPECGWHHLMGAWMEGRGRRRKPTGAGMLLLLLSLREA